MPPATSICIMSEVPERGNPETIVIMRLRKLPEISPEPRT